MGGCTLHTTGSLSPAYRSLINSSFRTFPQLSFAMHRAPSDFFFCSKWKTKNSKPMVQGFVSISIFRLFERCWMLVDNSSQPCSQARVEFDLIRFHWMGKIAQKENQPATSNQQRSEQKKEDITRAGQQLNRISRHWRLNEALVDFIKSKLSHSETVRLTHQHIIRNVTDISTEFSAQRGQIEEGKLISCCCLFLGNRSLAILSNIGRNSPTLLAAERMRAIQRPNYGRLNKNYISGPFIWLRHFPARIHIIQWRVLFVASSQTKLLGYFTRWIGWFYPSSRESHSTASHFVLRSVLSIDNGTGHRDTNIQQ